MRQMTAPTFAQDPKAGKTVGDIMTTDLVTLKLGDTLRLADDIMNLAKIRHFPVLDGDKIAGLINQSDLLHASMRTFVEHPKDSLRKTLGAVAVKEVMIAATTVPSGTAIREAARIMVEKNVECLLILQGDKLAGLVTKTDLLRELAKI
jgi:CBS domain-containing membrane protein